jgi:hypothetical protein
MFITNRKIVAYYLNYQVSGQPKQVKINPNSTVEIPEITEISQVIFDTLERKQRSINERFGRNIDTGVDYRLVLSGDTL